jgi:hypothetical protein
MSVPLPTSPHSEVPAASTGAWSPPPSQSRDEWTDPPPAPAPVQSHPERGARDAAAPFPQSWSVSGTGSRRRDPAPTQGPFWEPDDHRPGRSAKPAENWFDDDVFPVESRPPGPPPRPSSPPAKPKLKSAKPGRPRTTAARRNPPPSPKRPPPSTRRPLDRSTRRRPADDWSKVAPVYDVDGPRIRLGLAWFFGALPAVLLSPVTAAVAYAVAVGFAARQTVRAWRGISWQADLAAGLAAVPVLAAVLGIGPGVLALGAVAVVALGAGLQAPLAGLWGTSGRVAAAGVLMQATLPVAVAGAAMVLVRTQSVAAAFLLLGLASAYEMGDFLVGSAASNQVEGPLAGGAAVIVAGLPMALLLVEPFDVMGATMLGIAALCCPVGQWVASAVLPRPGASAPALRRIDTLLLLAPIWAIASGVF